MDEPTPPTPVPEPRPEMDDRPPILGSWRNLYTAEIALLGVLILALWRLTAAFS